MLEKSGVFIAILIINASVLLMLSGMVIYHFLGPQIEVPMTFSQVKAVPPPPKPPLKGSSDASRNKSEVSVAVTPPVSTTSVVVSVHPITTFTMATATTPTSLTLPSFVPEHGSGMGSGTAGGKMASGNPFGDPVSDGGAPALVGYFYDLKQTSKSRSSNMSSSGWVSTVQNLVKHDLDESVISGFLKSSDARSTNGLAIPEQASANAPTAFGLGQKVKPSLWVIVYHAKLSAPKTGRFRFVGFGDDLIVARVNGKYVFDGGWQHFVNDPELKSKYTNVWSSLEIKRDCGLRIGSYFSVTEGEQINLDVAIGDMTGLCGYFLFLEEEGAHYDKTADGTPKLPLFQVGAKLPVPSGAETPPASDSDLIWIPQ